MTIRRHLLRRSSIRLAATAIVALTCSAWAADVATAPAPAPLRLTVTPAKDAKFPFGKVVDTKFAVTNTSDRAMVVMRVGDEKLSSSVYGSIDKDPAKDVYHH